MNFFKIIIVISFFISFNAFSQKIIKHKIKSGESIYGLALKYDLSEKDIYELNPKAKGALLQLNQVISIPNKKYKEKATKKEKKELVVDKKPKKEISRDNKIKNDVVLDKKDDFITHLVAPKETLYSISKKYGITMETICELNPQLKTDNLKKGTNLKLPNNSSDFSKNNKEDFNNLDSNKVTDIKLDELVSNVDIVHKVLPKETLYRISKQYNVSIDDLEKLNPGIENGLPVDYVLVIKKGSLDTISEGKEVNTPKEKIIDDKDIPAGNSAKAEILIAKASEHLGTHYRSGGTTSSGYDCSGLMFATFKNIDMTLPRSSQEMANYGVRIDKSHAQKGDLIFFATFGGKRVSHVGMITEVSDGEIKFIHSSTSTGVIISSINENYYSRTFVQINRVITE